ncbi:recombinase family protein [Rubrobacter tropicus]|nr:hypothetical protein [Rubrobacter tropicus]
MEIQRRDLEVLCCKRFFEEQVSSRKADRPEFRATLKFSPEIHFVWVPR